MWLSLSPWKSQNSEGEGGRELFPYRRIRGSVLWHCSMPLLYFQLFSLSSKRAATVLREAGVWSCEHPVLARKWEPSQPGLCPSLGLHLEIPEVESVFVVLKLLEGSKSTLCYISVIVGELLLRPISCWCTWIGKIWLYNVSKTINCCRMYVRASEPLICNFGFLLTVQYSCYSKETYYLLI